jgi:predicted ferric reductase
MPFILIIANIVGYIGFVLLYLQVVLGTRHVFGLVTKDTVLMNKIHSWLGKYGILAVVAHPLLSMMNRLEDIIWIFTPNFVVRTETYITLGRFALIAFLVVWVTSALVREKLKWTQWKYIHLLAYPIVLLIFLHIKEIGSFYESFIFIQALWMFFFGVFIGVVIYRLLLWAGFLKTRYIVTGKELIGDSILVIKLTADKGEVHTSSMGQHFFLQSGRWKSEHPFSVIRNDGETLTFGIRKLGRFWDEITSKAVGESVLVDGAYGVFTREAQNDAPKVFISAGIGVTPFVDVVEHFGKNAFYINCNRTLGEVVERETLKSHVAVYRDIVGEAPQESDPSVMVGMITKERILEIVGAENVATLPFFICGSPGFIGVVKNMLGELGVPASSVYDEELGF